MIDIELVRANPEAIAENLARRGVERSRVHELHAADAAWRNHQQEVEQLRAQQRAANVNISAAAGSEREQLIAAMGDVSQQLKQAATAADRLHTEREQLWRSLPNLLADDVPAGGAGDGAVVRQVPESEPTAGGEEYLAVAEPELIDTERAAKVSGNRFAFLRGELPRLQLALVSFAFDQLSPEGFIPIIPPVLIGEKAMAGMGYLDAHADEVYRTQDDLYLTGTSEQSIGPMHMDEVLSSDTLPLRYVAYSSCFRREAGSYGRDVRGIMRVHQFDKVEMFSFATPETSASEHEFLLAQQERLMQALELPYRVVLLAAEDLGLPAAKTYDIETWLPGQQTWRETHSTSNTTDYQARRLHIRTTAADKHVLVHMLNGTALAIGRMLIAIIENYQQADGSVMVPKALQPYVPFKQMVPGT